MTILDTNILLNLLLGRKHAVVVIKFIRTPGNICLISDYSFPSIGLHFFNKDKKELYLRFANEVFKSEGKNNLISSGISPGIDIRIK